jgi:hypothetical protein
MANGWSSACQKLARLGSVSPAGHLVSPGWSAVAEDGGSDLGEMLLDIPGHLAVAFRRRVDAQCLEQLRRRGARISGPAEDRVQALVGQVVEHEVDNAPGVICLFMVLAVLAILLRALVLLLLLVLLLIGPVHRAPPGWLWTQTWGIKWRLEQESGLNMRHIAAKSCLS